jgi:cellulose synthase/poly-beta-1,6-N-acetylglucosamine synthase-like glycosyltransferase
MKTFINGFVVSFYPAEGWRRIADHPVGLMQVFLLHTIPFALIPAVCWYLGVTRVGWTVAGDAVRLTPESALPMCVLFFFAMVGGVGFLGFMVRWMASAYGTVATLRQGITLISYTASPFFLAGVLGLYPILWLDILVGCAIACYCIYLLYQGTPLLMQVPPERGFLYASAVFAVALVSFVGLLGATVVLWDFGAAPEYTY